MNLPPHRDLAGLELEKRDQKNFMMWFCFENPLKEKTLAQLWLEENPDIPDKVREFVFSLSRSNIGLYRVCEKECDERNLILQDVFTGDTFCLWDPTIHYLKDNPLIYGLRMVRFDEKTIFSAGDFHVFPSQILPEIKEFIHRRLQGFFGCEIDPPLSLPKGAGYILQHLRLTLQWSDTSLQKIEKDRRLKKGESISKIISHFTVLDPVGSVENLEASPHIAFLGKQFEYRFYEWYENTAMVGKDEPDAGIAVTPQKIMVHFPGRRKKDSVIGKLRRILKGTARHIYDTIIKTRKSEAIT